MDVIYLDNHILVLNKPAGLATQPSADSKESLEEEAKNWIKKEFKKPFGVFLHAVHRIDKPVSGLVLFARTSKALARLNLAMRLGKFSKKYQAIVEGVVGMDRACLEHFLIHGDRKAIVASEGDPLAKKCRLHFVVQARAAHFTQLEIDLETGRYHQIRAQLSAIGHPIVGDAKYGSRHAPFAKNIIALHQRQMSFPHPVTEEMLSFSCEPDFSLEKFS